MNAYLRTMTLPGAVRTVREHGASALDRAVVAWPAPEAAARILDRWGMPPLQETLPSAPWPAPDPVMRFDLPAPELRHPVAPIDGLIPWTDLVEPRYTVAAPDLQSVSRAAVAVTAPIETSRGHEWPAPTLATAAPTTTESDRSRFSTRAVVGLAAVAGALAAGAALVVALF